MGQLTQGNDEIKLLVGWCDAGFKSWMLENQWIIIDFRKQMEEAFPVIIKGQQINIVQSYKCLGVTLQVFVPPAISFCSEHF